MKNIELYRTIEALVEAKKQKISPTAPSFAHDYCQRQIEKKKLISFNPKQKMNRIMQNFNKVQTYVNVEQLFHYIHVAHEGKKKQDICQTMKWVSSQQQLGTVGYDLILKAREKLGPRNYQNYMRQNKDVGNLITDLENKSNVGIHKKQNSINTNDVNFFMQNTKDKKQEKEIKNFDKEKDIWKLYGVDKCACTDMSERRELLPLVVQRPIEKQSLKKQKQKNQLIHQVATYLQIILENQHKKKWGIHRFEKGCELFSARSASNSNRKEKCSRFSRKTQRNQKSSFIHSHCNSIQVSSTSTPKIQTERTNDQKIKIFLGVGKRKQNKQNKVTSNDSCSLNEEFGQPNIQVGSGKFIRDTKRSPTLNKQKLKENFTFRNRNIKTKLLRRINSFLDLVETEQQKLKKQKNISLNELNNLEYNNKINHSRFDKHSIVEDHQIKQVHNIVHLQK